MNNKQLATHITQGLIEKGVHVHSHSAISTSSFYLTFDGGVLKKARIGDHKGKGYHYTYEIGKHVQPPYEVELTYAGHAYTRYRYTDKQADDLITQVLILRSNLRSKYGKENYEAFREAALKKASLLKMGRVLKHPITKTAEYKPDAETLARRLREIEDERFTYNQQMEAMGPDFDPNGFSTY